MAPKIILLSLLLYLYYYYNSTRVHPPRSFQGLSLKTYNGRKLQNLQVKKNKTPQHRITTYTCRITTYKLKESQLTSKKIYSIHVPKKYINILLFQTSSNLQMQNNKLRVQNNNLQAQNNNLRVQNANLQAQNNNLQVKKKTSTYECRTTTTCERKNNNLLSLALALSLSRSLSFLALSLFLFLDSLSLFFSAPNFRVIGDLLKNFWTTV